MTQPSRPRTKLQRTGAERARRVRGDVITDIANLRTDCGLSRRAVAGAAGISPSTHADIEAGRSSPTIEVLARIATVLGASLSLRLYPGTGPLIRDHLQAAMVQALVRILDPRWRRRIEVSVHRPVRGVIDLVLEDPAEPILVTCEAQSELRRLEQQVRWAAMKTDALVQDRAGDRQGTIASRLLLLRSTRSTRAVVSEYADLLAIAYPAHHRDLVAALRTSAPWPGPGIVWCDVHDGVARILDRPPRGMPLGRRR